MAWEQTDKALASLLLQLPQVYAQAFFIAIIYFIFKKLSAQPQAIQQGQEQEQEQPPKNKQKSLPNPPTLKASDHITDKKHHLLLAATGSVATIKLPNIILALSHHKNLSIRIILTKASTEFLQGQADEQPPLSTISTLPNVDAIYLDEDEWRKPWVRGDSILHIELRRWADVMVIAPLSANALAKVVTGLSDGLVYSVVRAWDTSGSIDEGRPGIALPYNTGVGLAEGVEGVGIRKKGIIVAPAMNTAMWNHPVTRRHLDILEGDWNVARGGWIEVLGPVDKGLACGDKGGGGMREWKEIVEVVEERMGLKSGGKEISKYVAVDA